MSSAMPPDQPDQPDQPDESGAERLEPWGMPSDTRPIEPPPASAYGPSVPAGFGPAPASQFVLTIGDIGITSDGLVVTPNGTAPLRETRWIALDQSMTTRTIPAYAIVLAVIFALFCLLGLLFLLIKEDRTTGYVLVSVSADHLQHSTQIPVVSPLGVAQVRQRVAQAQSMAASA